jgi:hypothetical protein
MNPSEALKQSVTRALTPVLGPKAMSDRKSMLFDLLAERGEDMLIEIELLGPNGPVVKHSVEHRDADGLSAFLALLNKGGIEFVEPKIPARKPPKWSRRVAALVQAMRPLEGEPTRWLRRDGNWSATSPRRDPPSAYRVLSAEETALVLSRAKLASVSQSALLLQALDATITPRIADVSGVRYWAMPVNMRGVVDVAVDQGNVSTLLPLAIPRASTASDVERAIRASFKRDMHWGKWDRFNVMSLLGKRVARRMLDTYYRGIFPSQIGLFNQMGTWSTPKDPELTCVGFGPLTFVEPLRAEVVIMNDRMTVSLRLHPSIGVESEELASWVDDWVRAVLPEEARPGSKAVVYTRDKRRAREPGRRVESMSASG